MYILRMTSGCTHKEVLFVSLDDLDNISILLDESNDLEEEVSHLFNKKSILKLQKRRNLSGSKYTQNMYCNTG